MRTLLIANRGEIAVRIMRTARRMGLRTVAVYSEADSDAEHVRSADAALCIGAAAPRDSYLNIPALLAAARSAGVDAVHPGYGFLAENAAFAAACEQAGLVFVGPSAEAIEAMGNKALAKQRMRAAGVPCIPGYDGEDTTTVHLVQEAGHIGFPLMVKAAAGGGGRGMRLVMQAADLPQALDSARSEAQSAFGDGRLILERALLAPRHVEVQVMADAHGHTIHLGERDCSIQRRHQKIVEEAPSPAVDAALRERMGASAVAVARQIGYRGAGTVEFLLDTDGAYYFMEMNTRLQVEHPVTEAVTGLDLVELQLRVAAGEPLPLTQDDVRITGHAIEVRLCAESPDSDFLPQTGTVALWQAAPGLRTDHALRSGSVVSPWYDSMLGKVVAHGSDRAQAAQRLADGLDRTVCLGLPSNRAFLAAVLRHPAFLSGDFSTGFIAAHFSANSDRAQVPGAHLWAVAAAVAAAMPVSDQVVGDDFLGWSSTGLRARSVRLGLGDETRRFSVVVQRDMINVHEGNGPTTTLRWLARPAGPLLRLELDGLAREVHLARKARRMALQMEGREALFEDLTLEPVASAASAGASGALRAPLNGRVVKVMHTVGDALQRGDAVVVLEAMKMEHVLTAPHDGTLAELNVVVGDQVSPGQPLALVEAPAAVVAAVN
ncbi:acetyl/propionyl/methylcrotonyl-CoA carboxylase subunit alpha [Hydrogenophaga sp.]|uniref:acetyl/propionyl/methylcrotonyl-CoA carboxylase subunit alpha n=1 Tax=Hydrogenophaga sp. TaxID=1904254 RepID=UPI003F70A3A1